jgi:putative ABC transport system permease protein
MAACFFIFQYVHFELSYDRFNKNSKNIYRVPIEYYGRTNDDHIQATNHPAVGPALKADFPEVIAFARLIPSKLIVRTATISSMSKSSNVISFNEKRVFLADQALLTMFSIPFVFGNPSKALTEERSVVISKSEAEKYFGGENPIGKTLYLNGGFSITVTGVFEDIPENSHLKFDMLISFPDGEKFNADLWKWPEFYTYVMLAPGTDPHKVEAKFPAFVDKYLGSIMKQYNFKNRLYLQPLREIHLNSNYRNELEVNGSGKEIYFLNLVGVFILIIAWINYINLSTARSMERATEVGMRKVVGASRLQLIRQFLIESVLVNILSLFFAAIIVLCLLPFYKEFTGQVITRDFWTSGLLSQPGFWISLLATIIGGSFLIGIYPALILAKFNPVLVLKGRFHQSGGGIILRKVLVSFQFILSIFLFAGSLIVFKQLTYMRNQSLGYNKDEILIVKTPTILDSTINGKINSFKLEIQRSPSINHVGISSDIPGEPIVWSNGARMAGKDQKHDVQIFLTEIDNNFLDTYQMGLMAGRNFVPGDSVDVLKSEKIRVMVNEALVKDLGFSSSEDAVNKVIIFGYGQGEVKADIVGVIKNYHQRSLKNPYDPILYMYPSRREWKYFSININSRDLNKSIQFIESNYKNSFAGNPFEYFFLNEFFNEQYKADQQFGKVFSLFTGLAIFVSCLGLLGLSGFVIKLRTKEIGIRRVLGASIYGIIMLLFKDFLKLVILASLIAIPVIYVAADKWLDNFAFHIPLSLLFFIVPPIVLVIITLITIGIQSLKAALSNPANSINTLN